MPHEPGNRNLIESWTTALTNAPRQVWTKPVWVTSRTLAVLWVTAVVYGSLLPFDFDTAGYVRDHGGLGAALVAWIMSPRWDMATGVSSLGVPHVISDLLINVALYLPLGVLLRLSFRGGARRALLCVLAAAGLSWLIECTQSLSPSRYAALPDVLTNTLAAAAGVWSAIWLLRFERGAVFWAFQKTAQPIHTLRDMMRRRRSAMHVGTAIGAALIGAWCAWAWPTNTPGDVAGVNLLPFAVHLERSYDVAGLLLSRSLIVYGVLGALVMLLVWPNGAYGRIGWLAPAMALPAVCVAALRAATGAAQADVTEVILAIVAAGSLLIGMYLLIHAARCSCRRRHQRLFDGPDRRRRAHDYSFRIASQG